MILILATAALTTPRRLEAGPVSPRDQAQAVAVEIAADADAADPADAIGRPKPSIVAKVAVVVATIRTPISTRPTVGMTIKKY